MKAVTVSIAMTNESRDAYLESAFVYSFPAVSNKKSMICQAKNSTRNIEKKTDIAKNQARIMTNSDMISKLRIIKQ